MAALVDIQDLDFSYGDQVVLKDLALPIEQGTTLGVIGPNGGGKTTLMKLMLGLLNPTSGTITLAGQSPREATRIGNVVGYLPQQASSKPRLPLRVREVAQLGLAGKTGLFRSYAKSDLEFVESLIEKVGLKDVAERPATQLSGGQLQRLLIARALAPQPKLLLLDEPTTGIDRMGQEKFITFLQSLKEDLGLTIVFVSHDLRAVTAISDRIACLNATLHYHDVPQHLPADLVYKMFACDLEAIGISLHGSAEPELTPLRISARAAQGV